MRALPLLLALSATPLLAGVNAWTNSGPEEAQIVAMAVSPRNASLIVAAGKFAVFRSTDAGESWTRVMAGGRLFGGSLVRFDPQSNDVWIACHHGLMQSDDGGATWLATPSLERNIAGFAIDPSRHVDYAATTEGLFVREGAEGRWEKRAVPGADERVADVEVDPSSGTVWAGKDEGLFESRDQGRTWSPLAAAGRQVEHIVFESSSTLHILNDTSYRRSSDRGRSWSAAGTTKMYAIALAAPKTLYATADADVLQSVDDGRTWLPIAAPPGAPLRLPAVDPHHPSLLYAPAFDDAVYKSSDGGKKWTRKTKGLAGIASDIVLDPQHAGTLFALGTHLYKSSDGGTTWTAILRGTPMHPLGHLAVTADSTITVEDLFDRTAKRSRDGGKSWSEGAVAKQTFRRMVSGKEGRLYRIEGEELLTSRDGGATWKKIEVDAGHTVYDVALDPTDASRVFAALENGVAMNATAGSGPWKLLNRGLPSVPIRSIAIHPLSPNTMLAGTESQGIYATNTTGETWVRFRPENGPRYVSRVVIDPLDPTRIYVATEGESVFAMQIPAPSNK